MTANLDLFPDLPRTQVAIRDDWPPDYEAQFWRQYPRRIAKADAMKKLRKIREQRVVTWAKLIGAVLRYAAHVDGKDQKYTKHPATWLNQGCWDDEYPDGRGPITFATIGWGD